MEQRTYHIKNYEPEKLRVILAEIAMLPAYALASHVLVAIMEQNWHAEESRAKAAMVKEFLPKATPIGITHYDETYPDTDVPHNTLLSFMFFASSSLHVQRFDMAHSDATVGRQLNGWLNAIPDVKGVMVFFAKKDRDISLLLTEGLKGFPDVPAFGSDASHELIFHDSPGYVFNADGCYENALLAVAFAGKDLRIKADCNFGWIPVGKTFTITALDTPYAVAKIDGMPAAELYRHYLGIPYQQIEFAIENVCEFPFVSEYSGMRIGRIPNECTTDGKLIFHATMHAGEQLRFSYGRPQQIFEQIYENARSFNDFKAEAMFMIICMNRMIFLKDQEHLETDAYRAYVPSAAFMHGNSEIYFRNGKGGEMHSALIAIGFAEGNQGKDSQPAKENRPVAQCNRIIPFEQRMATFLTAITHDLEKTTEELTLLKESLEDEVERKTQENERLSLHVVQTLAEAIDAKDSYTKGHSGRVAQYAMEIAKRAGYTKKQQRDIYMMGLLHDVGKIGVPDAVIAKPGRLSDEEFAEIKKHPALGHKILAKIQEMPKLSIGARWHHERYDGHGYPDGIRGQDIPEEARIIAVADAYDAMTSNRSYRQSMPQSAVREQLVKGKGTQFDPRFADIMIQMIDEDTGYAMHEHKQEQ